MTHKIANGAIIGIASEDGIAAKKRIGLIDRSTMQTVSVTQSDQNGAYTFNGLDPNSDSYIVFAVDDDGSPKKAALIFDYVKPIPAHAGGFFWSNWYYIAMQKEPLVSGLAIRNTLPSGIHEYAFGSGSSETKVSSLSRIELPMSETPGAANIPSVKMYNGFFGKHARRQKDKLQAGDRTAVSCEWVFKPLDQTRDVVVCLVNSSISLFEVSSTTYTSTILMLRYSPSDKRVTIYRHKGTSPGNGTGAHSYLTDTVSYTIPEALLSTSIHLAASLVYAEVATIYVNGLQVASEPITDSVLRPGISTSNSSYMIGYTGSFLGSEKSTFWTYNNTDFQFSLFSIYSEAMTEQEAMTHYKALFEDTLPLVTGYVKAVIEDYPSYYFRMGDANSSAIAIDALRPFVKNSESAFTRINLSGLASSAATPFVRGGKGIEFSGGFLLGEYVEPIIKSPSELTIEFVARPNAIGLQQVILCHFRTSTITSTQLEITTAGKWKLSWEESGVSVNAEFEPIVDTANMHHYVFTINKRLGEVSLYVDGTLAGVRATPTSPLIDVYNPTLTGWSDISIGARRIAGSPVTAQSPYNGYLSELAIYPTALSPISIKTHYEARLII